MKLIIFDLDQTLVDFVPLHNELTHRLFKKYFAVEAWLSEIDHHGRSQSDGMRNLAKLKGVPEIPDSLMGQILEEFGRDFAAEMPHDVSASILPGARELLDSLSHTDNVIALYTGDAPEVVSAVFQATGFGKYFAFRFYGTQFAERAEMVKMAVEKAQQATGWEFKDANVVIVGDALRDVECGLKFNAFTISVANRTLFGR